MFDLKPVRAQQPKDRHRPSGKAETVELSRVIPFAAQLAVTCPICRLSNSCEPWRKA
jgi:hypothetical protein